MDGESTSGVTSPDEHLRELKWKELMSRVDAYRFYIKLILEINAFYYATTGAVILFALKDSSTGNSKTSGTAMMPFNYPEAFFLLPILMGTVIGSFLIYAAALQKHNEKIIEGVQKHLPLREIPDLNLLYKLLLVFGVIFLIVAGVLSFVLRARTIHWIPGSYWPDIGILVTFAGFVVALAGYFWYSQKH